MGRFELARADDAAARAVTGWQIAAVAALAALGAAAWRRHGAIGHPAGPSPRPAGVQSWVHAEVPPERHLDHHSVPAHFEATARSHPERVALRTATQAVTYRDLLSAAVGAAATRAGVGPAQTALVRGSLTPATVSTILGLFATGTTVVAVDPETPAGRVDTIAAILRDHGHDVARVGAPSDPVPSAPACGFGAALAERDLGDVTSIQFTSGSTGVPKAVLHTHGLWLADAQLLNDRFGIVGGRAVALCMPISFAGGLNVLIGSLVGGAEIVAVDPREHSAEEAFRRIRDSRAQIVTCTPTFVDALHSAAAGGVLPDVERIVTTGEPTQARHVRLARELAPAAVFTNWVGSTETLAIASYDIPPTAPLPRGIVPVGIPSPHKKIEVTDDGIVSITSRYLGPGYLDRAETAARFVDNGDGSTTYVGGDVGRWNEQGHLVLSGRADSTVKIRGYLVEPAEIEATLAAYSDIREVAVVAEASRPPKLTAYVAPSTTERTPSTAELRTRLHHDLPPWMVPANIVILSALPRGDRGKVDRTALPSPTRPDYEVPVGPVESAVARLWAETLRIESVGRTDSFYALGGDSLSAQQMLITLEDSHGAAVKPCQLAGAPTVAEFAAFLGADFTPVRPPGRSELRTTTVPLRALSPKTVGAPLFCFTGAGASSLCFRPLAEYVGEQTAVYAFEPSGLNPGTFPDWSVQRAVRRHYDDLRRIQEHGPYVLIGHSLGAHLALETARLLETEGETVEMVVLLDPWLSPRVARRERREVPGATVTLQTDDANGFGPWWDRQRKVPLAGLFLDDYDRRTLAVEEAGMIAGFRHRPEPWGGRALLMLSHLNTDDPRLWPRILTGDLQTRVLACNHHSMVRPPHIGVVADVVAEARERLGAPAPR